MLCSLSLFENTFILIYKEYYCIVFVLSLFRGILYIFVIYKNEVQDKELTVSSTS